ncbi:sigma-70 family RNA polymerase sigma factor [Nocardioides daejeonensis]|uniref:sigma-70 family RNA polymerase sigma factor n=1 Tax=Nocardioides daejeonensis TaxID=1046556 RepID=UPI000D74185B|nr:sigma-70 family RNA polymerase sigma factor [Nocardioides daejeonensis]
MARNIRENRFDDLPRQERRRLTATLLKEAAATDDPDTRKELLDRVVLANLGVARSIAARYRSRGIPTEDLEQVASAALVRASQHFDAGRERDFLSYAVPSIRGELRRYFRDHGWTVRPPRRVQEIQSRVVEVREQLRAADGRNPTDERIAEELEVPAEEVTEALRAEGCFTPASLDMPVGAEGSASLAEMLAADDEDRDTAAAEARVLLRPVVRQLRPRDQRLLRMRFVEERTQQEIADEFGVTQTQVSRLLSRVLRELRESIGELAPAG